LAGSEQRSREVTGTRRAVFGPARPFVKWAGGKQALLASFEAHFPGALRDGSIRRYVEPFMGSGAVLFHLLARHTFDDVVIIDRNPILMTAYRVVQHDVHALIELLSEHQSRFWSLGHDAREAYYRSVRDAFNQGGEDLQQAARLIFLNRTCFNGLSRVNRHGAFNVPMGRYDRPLIADRENLLRVHRALAGVRMLTGPYTLAAPAIDEQTFVYLDPPYRPLTATASFTAYHPESFTDRDQVELAAFFRAMADRGAYLMLSNSDPLNVDPADAFFDRLYGGFPIHRLSARRSINARADRRGAVSELVITSYESSADRKALHSPVR